MTYLFKLAKRLSFNHFSIWVVLLAMVACTDAGDPTDPVFQSSGIVSMQLWPQDPTLAVGDSIDFIAFGLTAEGDTVVALDVTWSADGGEIKGNGKGKGRYHARAVGRNKVTAVKDSLSDSTTVTVTAVPAASIEVTPANVTIQIGETLQLTAVVKDADGNELKERPVEWVSANSNAASVSDAGLVTGVAAGFSTIRATTEGQSGTAQVMVTATAQPVATVDVTPATAAIGVGDNVQLYATPRDAAGNALPGRLIVWSSAARSIATVDGSGVVTGVAEGTAGVIATSEGKSGSAAVTVSSSPIVVASVDITPATASVEVGSTVQLTATVRDAAGNELAGRAVSWASNAVGVATVSGSGLVTGVGPGSATITATSEGQSGAADISVVSDTTEFITGLTPTRYDVARLGVGDQYYVDRTLTLTSLPPGLADRLWIRTANDDKAATADPFLSFTLLEDAVVVVAYDTRATVLPNWLQGWDQAPVSIGVSDGRASPLTILHKSFPAGAVGLGGNLAAGAQGAQSMYGVVLLRTSEIDPVALELAPASATLDPGENAQFSATVTDPLGRPTGGTLEWAATGGTITAQGLYTAGAVPGTYAVTATETGSGLSNSVGVAIRDTNTASVASVEVTPATASVAEGGTVQLSATLKDAAGNVLTGHAVSWSSNNTGVATVNGSGLVSGVGAGTATITATSEGQSGTATVTVTVAPVSSVSVTPSTASVFTGASVQLTATLKDSAGNELTGRTVNWSSDTPTTASVDANGLVTGESVGTVTITALSEGVSGTAQVNVLTQNPADTRITGIAFDWATYRRDAGGSDNWPLTWCEDGHQYSSWGDGGGFGGTNDDGRVSLGFARIEGAYANFTGYNVWGGKNPEHAGADFSGKVRSMLCINGTLYALRSPASNYGGWNYKEVAKSTDKAASWSIVSGSRLVGDAPGAPGEAFYLQYGQNYSGNTDGFVYIYSVRISDPNLWEVQQPGVTWLARAPVANEAFVQVANWEWVTGFNGTTPVWGAYADRAPVLEDADGFMRGSAIYVPGLDRYVMVTNHTARNQGNIAFWEAPEPWGPWSLLMKESGWPQGGEVAQSFAFGNFSPKWLDANGNCVFVWFRPDAWNSVTCHFETAP